MQQATSLIAIFGVGAAIGGFIGGLAGAKLYAYKRLSLPLFMGITLTISAVLLQELMSVDLQSSTGLHFAYPLLIISGAFSAINSANVRTIVLNLTTPELRVSSIAILNFINCLGRGIGPAVIEVWMDLFGLSRRDALSSMLNLWIVAGLMICCSAITITRDEERFKMSLRQLVTNAMMSKSTSDLALDL